MTLCEAPLLNSPPIDGGTRTERRSTFMNYSDVTTPLREFYFCIQRIELEDDLAKYTPRYFQLMRELLASMPWIREAITIASLHVLAGDYDDALAEIGALIAADKGSSGQRPPASGSSITSAFS
ncbi:flagellar biosynthesis repressor FlbT [Rhodopseudomonas sp.]|uniref:flagellar biosynthesis repressor FlbT n=1 Tax=Rhodopseudomonas sp. TaxID=1078 RepID=UPI0039E3B49B